MLPFVSLARHQRLMIEAEAAGRERGAMEATTAGARVLAEARTAKVLAERFAKRLERDLDKAQAEVRRLTDIIIEMKKEGRSLPAPIDETWESYTTAEADTARARQLADPEYQKRMAEIEEHEELASHQQMPTTDGGPHTGYADALELEAAARRAIESELPPM